MYTIKTDIYNIIYRPSLSQNIYKQHSLSGFKRGSFKSVIKFQDISFELCQGFMRSKVDPKPLESEDRQRVDSSNPMVIFDLKTLMISYIIY